MAEGNQTRKDIDAKLYEIAACPTNRDIILCNKTTYKIELWREADDSADCVLVIDGTDYEFIRTLN